MKFLITFLIFLTIQVQASSVDNILGKIAVQDSGRIKPFDTFATESLQLIYGKKKYNGKSAVEIVFTWLLLPQEWQDTPFIKIDNHELKKQLGFDVQKKYYSPNDILTNLKVEALFKDLDARREAQEKLNPYYQSVQNLQNQITLFKAIAKGYVPGFYPIEGDDSWVAPKDFSPDFVDAFSKIISTYATAVKSDEFDGLRDATLFFIEKARSQNVALYPSNTKIFLEIKYNEMHPFQWAWTLYLIAAFFIALNFIYKKEKFYKWSVWTTILAFIFHTYGFFLRIIIAERPPVTNMYETVVWVPWAAIIFAFILARVHRGNKFYLLSGNIICFLCLVLADQAPAILDPSIQPLQPVLRSNFWLIVHVLTITLSYGAFFLSFIMGDIALGYHLVDEKKYSTHLASLRDAMYRSIQIGVVLLGAGTILGGIWADYSWGRFWGWDPKETWALIAFLGYIAIIHGRFAGWINPFGFSLWVVMAFNLVIMAWYGVNFVLGAGLHSYGFGAGGVEFMAIFTGIHILYATTVWFIRMQRKTASS